MISAVSEGVRISVVTEYQPAYSSPMQAHFVFTYRITIENVSENTLQLMFRRWTIYDSNGIVREVSGDGVVGQQPVLEPGESHTYVSGCNLKTGMGKMKGIYIMERIFDGRHITVDIPEFTLITPYHLN